MFKIGQSLENIQKRCFKCNDFVRFGNVSQIIGNARIEITDSKGNRSCLGDEKDYRTMGGRLEEVE